MLWCSLQVCWMWCTVHNLFSFCTVYTVIYLKENLQVSHNLFWYLFTSLTAKLIRLYRSAISWIKIWVLAFLWSYLCSKWSAFLFSIMWANYWKVATLCISRFKFWFKGFICHIFIHQWNEVDECLLIIRKRMKNNNSNVTKLILLGMHHLFFV